MLFSAVDRTSDAPLLREFERLIRSAACVLDIGTNVGIYTYHAAVHARPETVVLGIEANPALAELVNHNLEANDLHHAEVINAAVTDGLGAVELHVGKLDLVSSLEPAHVAAYGGSSGSVTVPGVTLDAVVEERGLSPGVFKIDVEGHELAVLRGASRTLELHRPALLIEVTEATGGAVHDMLLDYGYRGWRFDTATLTPLHDEVVPEGHPLANLLYRA